MELSRDKVLQLVKLRGPLLPNDLKKALGGDTMLLGAVLSELASKGLVKVSKTRLGGSPFYYDPGNPASLERISNHLNEKDRRTYLLLKERRVLRDDRQEPLVRVSLRNIKDYAVPLTVKAPEGALRYWKYFLVPDREAERLIKRDLGLEKPGGEAESPAGATTTSTRKGGEPKGGEQKGGEPREEPKGPKGKPPDEVSPRAAASTPQGVKNGGEKKPTQETRQPNSINDPFLEKVKAYFAHHKILVKEEKVVRKKRELEFLILLPTPVGSVEYYCKAKAKQQSNEGDLAAAKLQGQSRGLPTLYLTTGVVTKKAKEKLATELRGVVVQELPKS